MGIDALNMHALPEPTSYTVLNALLVSGSTYLFLDSDTKIESVLTRSPGGSSGAGDESSSLNSPPTLVALEIGLLLNDTLLDKMVPESCLESDLMKSLR